MSYTDLYTKRNTKAPYILALVAGLGIMALVVRFALPTTRTQATKRGLLSVEVSNMFSGQASILWQTDAKNRGWLTYGEDENDLTQIATDDRDGQDYTPHLYHYVTLKGLKKNTRYYFKITDGDSFLQQSGKSLFTFQTIGSITQINNLKPAYGKITDRSGAPYQNAIIVLDTKGIYPLSTVSKSSGEWLIPLNYTINRETGNFTSLGAAQPIRLHVYSDDARESFVTATVAQVSPIDKPLVLGQTYVLHNDESVLSTTSQRKAPELDITYPADNALIPAQKPLIKGSATPNAAIKISITGGKKPILDTTTTNNQGQWKYSVGQLLEARQYILTVSTASLQTGRDITKTRTFTIAKSGVQVLGEATASASITPSATPTGNQPTPTGVTQPTATPVVVLQSPTPVIASASPTLIASGTATPAPPVSGNNIYTVAISSAVLIIFGVGLLVVF